MSTERVPRTRGWAFHSLLKQHTPVPHITYTLLGLNVLVFIITASVSGGWMDGNWRRLLDFGAAYAPFTTSGSWWRLITPMFLHADFLHLAFNMLMLWYMGRFLERLLGQAPFAMLYVGSGVFASVAGLYLTPGVISVGASGALFGLLGAIVGFLARRRRDPLARVILRPAGIFAVLFILYQVLLAPSEGIDVAAHATGGFAGLLLGFVMAHPVTETGVARRPGIALRTGVVTFAFCVAGLLAAPRYSDFFAQRVAFWNAESIAASEIYLARNEEAARGEALALRIATRVLPAWEQLDTILSEPEHGVAPVFTELVDHMRRYADARTRTVRLWLENVKADRTPFDKAFKQLDGEAKQLRQRALSSVDW